MALTDGFPKGLDEEPLPETEDIRSELEVVGRIPNAKEIVDEPLFSEISHTFDVTLHDGSDSSPTYHNESKLAEYSDEDLQDIHQVLLPSVLLVDADVHARHPNASRRYNVLVNGGRVGNDPWDGRIVSNRLPHIDGLEGEIYIAAFGGSTLVWNHDFEVPKSRTSHEDRLKAKQILIDTVREQELKPQQAEDGEFTRLSNATVHASCEDLIIGKRRLVIFITPEGAGVPRTPVTQSQM